MQACLKEPDPDGVGTDDPALARELAMRLPATVARALRVVPVGANERQLILGTADIEETARHLAELTLLLDIEPELVQVDEQRIETLLQSCYKGSDEALQEAVASVTKLRVEAAHAEVTDGATSGTTEQLFTERLLRLAVEQRASDIHIEPCGKEARVRMRVDGQLREMSAVSPAQASAIISRLKLLARMDTAQTRIPQDGRLKLDFAGAGAEARLAILPTVHGESATLRILDRQALHALEELGMPAPCVTVVDKLLARSHGMLLATGPTGSGKTTTLYAALRRLDRSSRKVLTVEDPIEFSLPDSIQVQVKPEIGLGFPHALRSFLRHDPDVILVGEIRDGETARTGAQAALTGHLVLASLHCSSSIQAPVRLVELGLEPWLVAAALELSLAQRLLRKTCGGCRGGGCNACEGSGFKGRLPLYEWLALSQQLREFIEQNRLDAYLASAMGAVLMPLEAGALKAVEEGLTTQEEVRAHLEP